MSGDSDGERAHWAALARHRLGLHPSVAARRKLAATLRAVADDLDRLADAAEPRPAPPARRSQGRRAGDFVRLGEEQVPGRDGRTVKHRLRLYVGRALWYAIGSPPRVDVQRVGGELRIVAVREGAAGIALSTTSGIPRAFVSQETWDILRLEEGRHPATVRGEMIIVEDSP